MNRKRPVTLLVLGILNLVFGGLNFVKWICCSVLTGSAFLLFNTLYQQAQQQDEEIKEVMEAIWAAFDDHVPGLVPVFISFVAISFVLATIQIVSGIGLVRTTAWGRWLSVVWGLLVIFSLTAFVFWQVVYLFPGIYQALPEFERVARKIEEKERQKGRPPAPRQDFSKLGGTGNPIIDNALQLGMEALEMGYAAAVVVFMLLPQTGRAIARYRGQDEETAKRHRDELYEDPYERNRRTPEGPPGEGGQS